MPIIKLYQPPPNEGNTTGSSTVTGKSSLSTSGAPVSAKLYDELIATVGSPHGSMIALAGMSNSPLSQAMMDPDTAAVILMDMIDKSGDADVKKMVEGLVTTLKRSEKLNEQRIKSYKDSIEKSAAAAGKEKEAQTSADIGLGFQVAGAVFGMLAAILLTMFTLGGGAAAIVGAAIGLTTTILEVGTRIAKATGATYDDPTDPTHTKKNTLDITLGGAIKRTIEQQEADGHLYPVGMKSDSEKAEFKSKYTMGWTIAINLAVAAAGIIAGGVTLFGAGKVVGAGKEVANLSGKVIKQAAQLVANVASAAQIVTDVGGATSMVAHGSYGIAIAHITFEKNELDNQRNRMDSMQNIFSDDMNSMQNHITSRVKDIGAIYEGMSDLVATYSESQSRVVRTI